MSAVVTPVGDDARGPGQVRLAEPLEVARLSTSDQVADAVLGDSFGTVLRALRLRAGMTLQAVADRVGCSHGHVGNLEAGRVGPSQVLAARLDHALGAAGRLADFADDRAPDRAAAQAPVFVADGPEITGLTAVPDSPRVDLLLPISLPVLEAACWSDTSESAASVEAMSDDELRTWAVSQVLLMGVATAGGLVPAPTTPEARRYLAVIRQRLPRAFGMASRELTGSVA